MRWPREKGIALLCRVVREGNAEVMFKQMTRSKREVTWLVEEWVEEQEVGHNKETSCLGQCEWRGA